MTPTPAYRRGGADVPYAAERLIRQASQKFRDQKA
jgi:hypothetical protein